jgi:hypothetical protein
LDIHFTIGTSCERAAPLAEKNTAPRHHALRSLISLTVNTVCCYYGSTALCWALATFAFSRSYTQSVGLLGREISPSQDLCLNTEQQKQNKRTQYKHPCLEWDSNPRSWDRANEEISCLRPRGHCDRPYGIYAYRKTIDAYRQTASASSISTLRSETVPVSAGKHVFRRQALVRLNERIHPQASRANATRAAFLT